MPTLRPHHGLGMQTTPIRPESTNIVRKDRKLLVIPLPWILPSHFLGRSQRWAIDSRVSWGLGHLCLEVPLPPKPMFCFNRNATFPLSEAKNQRKLSSILSKDSFKWQEVFPLALWSNSLCLHTWWALFSLAYSVQKTWGNMPLWWWDIFLYISTVFIYMYVYINYTHQVWKHTWWLFSIFFHRPGIKSWGDAGEIWHSCFQWWWPCQRSWNHRSCGCRGCSWEAWALGNGIDGWLLTADCQLLTAISDWTTTAGGCCRNINWRLLAGPLGHNSNFFSVGILQVCAMLFAHGFSL